MADQGIPPSNLKDVHSYLFPPPPTDAAPQPVVDEYMQISRDILATFTSPHGQRVWEWLWKDMVFSPGFDGNLGLDLGTAMGFAAEGKKALVQELYKRMEHAKNVGKA